MKTVTRYKKYLLFSLISSVISSVSVLLCIFEPKGRAEAILKISTAAIFWLGLIFEQLFIWWANAFRRSLQKRTDAYTITGLPGICSFFKTELGFFTDTTFIISLIVYTVLAIGKWGTDVVQYIFLFLIVLSFRWHCIANGKNYSYKRYLVQRRENDD